MPVLWTVSIKGIILENDQVCLVQNHRKEWELPGGRLEQGESPAKCLRREIEEELGIQVEIQKLIDTWVFEPVSGKGEVLIIAYECLPRGVDEIRISDEHIDLGWFGTQDLSGIPLPEGYAQAIRKALGR